MRLKTCSESGQALLIAIFIGLLLLMTIPVVVFVNTTGAMHRIAATNRDKGTAIAEEGIAYAQQLLSVSQTNWNNYLLVSAPIAAIPECTNVPPNYITAPDGGKFILTCNTTDPRLQVLGFNYEVYVKSTAYLPNSQGQLQPTRAIEAFFSHKTVAATFPTGQTVAAALAVGQAPAGLGTVEVELGPIMCWDRNIWTLDNGLNAVYLQRPRKFAVSGIAQRGTGGPPAQSDSKEYWTYTYPGFNPVIDLATYEAAAQNNSTCLAIPSCTVAAHCAASAGTNCDFDSVGSLDTAVFGEPIPPYTAPSFSFSCITPGLPCGIYVKGNAELHLFNPKLNNRWAFFIVDGTGLPTPPQLTLGSTGEGPGAPPAIEMPPTASLDNPFLNCAPLTQCAGTTNNPVDIKGFVYANGNLVITSAQTWTIDGVMRVDGTTTLTGAAAPNLLLYYNDRVSRNILTAPNNFQLMIDSQTEIPVQ